MSTIKRTRRGIIITISVIVIILATVIAATPHKRGKTTEFMLNEAITLETAERFRVALANKEKNDTVVIRIESPGGQAIAMYKMQWYLERTNANVVCIVDSRAASAAAIIFLYCPKKLILPKAAILIHTMQICADSSCSKYRPVNKSDGSLYENGVEVLTSIAKYLTADEYIRAVSGEDVVITGNQLNKRFTPQERVK